MWSRDKLNRASRVGPTATARRVLANWIRRAGVPGLVVAVALAAAPAARAKIAAGEALPDLAALGLEGDVPTLTGRVVVLDVWASWCAPCKASFPALAALHEEHAARGLVVLGVSVDQKARDYAAFVRRFAPPFPTVRDGAQAFARAFEPPAMPTTYLIDRRGRVRAVHTGFHGARTVTELRAEVVRLLEESP